MVSPTVPPLYNYQDRVVAWTAERDCGFWAIDMGLGKTRCAIEHIRRTGRPGIVFAPLQVAMSTWPKEVRKWADGMHYAVLHGPSKRDRLLTGADLLIINYDGLPWLAANHAGLLKGQVFPAREAEVGRDGGHRGGEDQQEQVIQRMADIEQQRGRAEIVQRLGAGGMGGGDGHGAILERLPPVL